MWKLWDAILCQIHDDVIKWKHFPRYWPLARRIYRSTVNFPHKGQCRGALMLSFICAWTNNWANNRDPCDLRHHRTHYHVIVTLSDFISLVYSDVYHRCPPTLCSALIGKCVLFSVQIGQFDVIKIYGRGRCGIISILSIGWVSASVQKVQCCVQCTTYRS